MLIKKALKILLTEDSGVMAIVEGRIRSPWIPKGMDYPCIAFWRQKTEDNPTVNAPTSSLTATFHFMCMDRGRDNETVELLEEAVRLAISGLSGIVSDGGSPEDTIRIHSITRMDSRDVFNDQADIQGILSIYEISAEQQRPVHA